MPSSISNSECVASSEGVASDSRQDDERTSFARRAATKRIGRALAVCALSFVLYQAAIWIGLVPRGDGIHQGEINLIRAQRYVEAMDTADEDTGSGMSTSGLSTRAAAIRKARVVVVGSSLSGILEKSLGPDFVDLGLSAGGAQTGLELVRRARIKPPLLLVEANDTLSRPRDDALLQPLFHPVWKPLRADLSALRQEYQPVGVFVSALRRWKNKGGADAATGLTAPDVRERLVRDAVAAQQLAPGDAQKTRELRLEMVDAARRARAQIEEIERGGTRVVLFRVPRDPRLETTPMSRLSRRVIEGKFPPNRYKWLPDAPPRAWQTNDGVHLTPAEAAVFSAWLRKVVQGRDFDKRTTR